MAVGGIGTGYWIVGVDCAVESARVGLALGRLIGDTLHIVEAECPGKRPVADVVKAWLPHAEPVLLALDAPLGWPAPLANALCGHQAGGPLQPDAHLLFRRFTDREVHRRYGKMPLDVGADRIARTAHSALRLLQELRDVTGQRIPLAWQPADVTDVAAIEVYPAATLRVHELPSSGYKQPNQTDVRNEIMVGLHGHLELRLQLELALIRDADILDAVVCVLAGADFLRGAAVPPPAIDPTIVTKEGWIWVREAPPA
jgi:hypothetical protein